jgi:hypothetical protein
MREKTQLSQISLLQNSQFNPIAVFDQHDPSTWFFPETTVISLFRNFNTGIYCDPIYL